MEELNFNIEQVKNIIIQMFKDGGSGITRSGRKASTHPYTGAFERSIEHKVTKEDNKIIIDFLGNEYGVYLRDGVSADRVPYTHRKRGEGKGGSSKYITGLHNWVKGKLGISDERESLSIAFAIAKSHSENGFPERDGILGSKWMTKIEEHADALDIMEELILKYIEYNIEKIKI